MNKQLASLMCLVIFATMPACRKCKKEKAAQKQQEEINTMIEIDNSIEQEKAEVKKAIAKF